MLVKTITWTRPDKTVAWPWEGLLTEYLSIVEQEPGLIHMSSTSTDTTFVQTVIWETEADAINHMNHPVNVALQEAQAPLIVERGITKTVEEQVLENKNAN